MEALSWRWKGKFHLSPFYCIANIMCQHHALYQCRHPSTHQCPSTTQSVCTLRSTDLSSKHWKLSSIAITTAAPWWYIESCSLLQTPCMLAVPLAYPVVILFDLSKLHCLMIVCCQNDPLNLVCLWFVFGLFVCENRIHSTWDCFWQVGENPLIGNRERSFKWKKNLKPSQPQQEPAKIKNEKY